MSRFAKLAAAVVLVALTVAGCGGESAEPDAELSVGDVSLKESFDIAYIGATAEPFAAILLRLSELELRQPGRIEELVPGADLETETIFAEFDLVIDSVGYFESQVDPDANRIERPTLQEIDSELGTEISVTSSGFNTAIDLYAFGLGGAGLEPIPWQEFILPGNQELLNPAVVEATGENAEETQELEEQVIEDSPSDSVTYFSVGEISPGLESALETSGLTFEQDDLESTSELSAELFELSEANTPFVTHLGFPSPITAAIEMRRIELPCEDLCPPLQNQVLKLQSSSTDPAVAGLFESASLTQQQYAAMLAFFSTDQDQQASVDAWIGGNTDIWSAWL